VRAAVDRILKRYLLSRKQKSNEKVTLRNNVKRHQALKPTIVRNTHFLEKILDSTVDGVSKMDEKVGITTENLSMEMISEFFRWEMQPSVAIT
jgi:hypothetical protein